MLMDIHCIYTDIYDACAKLCKTKLVILTDMAVV